MVFVALPNADFTNRLSYILPGGEITQVHNQEGGVRNNTLNGHVVHPGIVIRQAVQRGGNIYIQTHGIGYNRVVGQSVNILARRLNKNAASQNDVNGPKAFKALDQRAIQYFRNNY